MNALSGTAALTRLALRRDRFSLPAWILGLTAFAAATTALWANDFRNPTADLVQETHITATNPGIRMLGLASGPTVGAYAMVRDYLLLAVLAALMSIFAVVRHTRQSEETGRAELIGAAVVGRFASLAATLIVTVVANAVLAVLLGLGLMAAGQPAGGSLTAGAAVAAVGISFAGVAAVTTQLASSTRAASGLAAAVLGIAFLTSGIGNMAGNADPSGLRVNSAWPAWLSPIGWGQQMRPFGGNHWWPLALVAALVIACVGTAVMLAARRDFGQGLLPQRPGHARAGRVLRGPFGLAWRLQRGAFIGWAVGMLGFGFVMGGLIGQVKNSTGAARDWYTQMGGSEQILDAYRASVLQMAGMAAAIYAVQVLLRMRAEEADGPLEQILSTAVSRFRWAAGHAATAVLGSAALLLLFAIGTGIAAGGVLGDRGGQVRVLLGAALVQLPAILVVSAVVIAAVGLTPRFAGPVSWALLLGFILIGPLFGPNLKLPQWLQDVSPFTHIPKAPAVPVTAAPVLALTTAFTVLALAGLISLRHRNLTLPA
ncbi:ABC transporter permease [Kribbella sp. NPDC049174]|uniref:ABC transporter permease n=1 Tax=Kribbella sp. NPDC049174 TaxID=3364112 RepID=UPI003714AF98